MKNAKLMLFLGVSMMLVAVAAFAAVISGSLAQAQSERVNLNDRVAATISSGIRGGAVGVISGVQTDANGSEWLVYGPWRLVLIPSSDRTSSPDLLFSSNFAMVMTDGNAKHRHQISNFSLTEWTADDTSIAFDGTATITLRDGPVEKVPVTIKILNSNVIEISIDTSIVDHFGGSPIYGIVLRSTL